MAKRRVVVMLEPKVWDKLQELRTSSGAPVSELIRRAIDAFLAKKKE